MMPRTLASVGSMRWQARQGAGAQFPLMLGASGGQAPPDPQTYHVDALMEVIRMLYFAAKLPWPRCVPLSLSRDPSARVCPEEAGVWAMGQYEKDLANPLLVQGRTAFFLLGNQQKARRHQAYRRRI